jgi:hypothetical protein
MRIFKGCTIWQCIITTHGVNNVQEDKLRIIERQSPNAPMISWKLSSFYIFPSNAKKKVELASKWFPSNDIVPSLMVQVQRQRRELKCWFGRE